MTSRDDKFMRDVKDAVARAYERYMDRLTADETPPQDEVLDITLEAYRKILRTIDLLPAASRLDGAQKAIGISIRAAFKIFDAVQRQDIKRSRDRAKRTRFSDN